MTEQAVAVSSWTTTARESNQRSEPLLPAGKLKLTRGDTVAPENIAWLWPRYLGRGKLHLLAGAPGTGKTTIALALAAATSSGGQWPDGTTAEVGDVLIWSGEDSRADVLIPRLLAMGADRSRIHFVDAVDEDGQQCAFDPAKDFPALAEVVAGLDNLALIVVDPIVSAIAGDSHKNSETRRGLQPLVDIAERHGCALLGITHFSKGTAGRAITERVTGSLAFAAAARVVLATGVPAREGGEGSVLVRAKSNIGPNGGAFRYRVTEGRIEIDGREIVAAKVEWGAQIGGSAEDILEEEDLSPRQQEEAGPRALVRVMLADGPRSAREVLDEGTKLGYNERAIQRARKSVGALTRKVGMAGGHEWYLPEEDSREQKEPDAKDLSPSSPSSSSNITQPLEDDVDDTKSCCETASLFAKPASVSDPKAA